jgi:hypothetical protein
MSRLLTTAVATAALLIGTYTQAGHHEETTSTHSDLMEVLGCDFVNGATLEDQISFGRNEFTNLFKNANIDITPIIWEPLAVAAPFEKTNFRWINYYPNWASYQAADDLWNSKKAATTRAATAKISTCDMPIFNQTHMVVPTEAPLTMTDRIGNRLLIGRCELNDGATFADAKSYNSTELSKATRAAAGADRGQFMALPRIGTQANFDFLNIFYGTPGEMAKLLDGGMNGKVLTAQRTFAGEPPPYACEAWDLHKAHRLFKGES